MDNKALQDIVKAIIQSYSEPVKLDEILRAFDDCDDIEVLDVKAAIDVLLQEDETTQKLKEIAGGYRYQIKQKYSKWIQKAKDIDLDADKLSRAVAETVMYIAYHEPVSRAEIDAFRGCQTHLTVYHQLEERGWIKVVEYGGIRKTAALYRTTDKFLADFCMKSLRELPPLKALVQETVESLC